MIPGINARRMKPTVNHRPVIWECMLGTVYASNGKETRYFDYQYEEAIAFAGINPESDPRLYRVPHSIYNGPRRKQLVVGIRRNK
jgi:hypothetical protein